MKQGWRDVGGGKVRHDVTGEEVPIASVRPGHQKGHVVRLTDEEWETLGKLAAKRSRETRQMFTPTRVIREFLVGAKYILESKGWEHPSKAAEKKEFGG